MKKAIPAPPKEMTQFEKKGLELVANADEMYGAGDNNMPVIQIYNRAAIQFRLARKWGNAGEAFEKAADIQMEHLNRQEAATTYVDAANCFVKAETTKEAINCLEKAIEQYVEMGKYSLAAKYHQSIGETLETEGDLEKALEHKEAADYFRAEVAKIIAKKARRLAKKNQNV